MRYALKCLLISLWMMGVSAHAQSVTVSQPLPDQDFVFGETIVWQVVGISFANGIAGYRVETFDGQIFEEPGFPPGTVQFIGVSETSVVPDNYTTGSIQLLEARVDFHSEPSITVTLNINITGPDLQPPFYLGEAGILSVSHLYVDDEVKVLVSWNEASDNTTEAPEMIYHVYASELLAGLFTSDPVTSETGTLQAVFTPDSLDAPLYLGVRAEDKYGNEEMNFQILELDPFIVTRASAWSIYE